MRNLLRAGGARLGKNRMFWILVLVMFGMGAYMAGAQYMNNIRYQEQVTFDDCMFNYVIMIGCCSAIFCSLFTGTEYSDGTIRNKLLVGHTRWAIYCSELIISILAVFAMVLAFLISYSVLGLILLPAAQLPVETILFYVVISLLTSLEFVSVYHMLTMLIPRKSAAAVVCLLLFMILMVLAMVIWGRLQAPEFVSGYSLTVNGIEQMDPEPNPKYLQPAARRIYQCFLDILPSGQGLQLASREIVHPAFLMIYAAAVSAVTTIVGFFAFGKKDLK